ncbi:MAG: molybdenum cofactor biosynthesis protein MoaE [Alphaproteobacteria bacterium]|nr:molybdenum cofactor biosynthesis protein MoaE [Alphaproteobacteria bacterium]
MTVRVQKEDFNVGDELSRLCRDRTDIGACVTFTGLVRNENANHTILDMTLEHYPGMTEAELERIEAEAATRWPLQASLIVHRVGKLLPGEQIVLVIAASLHRQAAFEAAQFMMDFLKSDAPLWKKETRADGETEWVSCRDSDAAAKSRWKSP